MHIVQKITEGEGTVHRRADGEVSGKYDTHTVTGT